MSTNCRAIRTHAGTAIRTAAPTLGKPLVEEYAGDHLAGQAKLVRGRTHLPESLRAGVELLFLEAYGGEAYDWMCLIVDEYVQLKSPDDLDRMVDLADDLARLELIHIPGRSDPVGRTRDA